MARRADGRERSPLRVGSRVVVARMLGGDEVEQDLGAVRVGERELVGGYESSPSTSATRTRSWSATRRTSRSSARARNTRRFPNRTNVQVARVDAPGEVTARVWERGVGETTASGTSAIAVAAATHGRRRGRRSLPRRRPARPPRARARLPARPGRTGGRIGTDSARRPPQRPDTLTSPGWVGVRDGSGPPSAPARPRPFGSCPASSGGFRRARRPPGRCRVGVREPREVTKRAARRPDPRSSRARPSPPPPPSGARRS